MSGRAPGCAEHAAASTRRPPTPAAAPRAGRSWGCLSFGEELSGYDLKQWADWSLSFFYWAPSYSQIYGELHKLEEIGCATSRVRTTRTTSAGEAALPDHPRRRARRDARWAADARREPAVLKHGVMLRMWLGHAATRPAARSGAGSIVTQSERMRVSRLGHAEGAAPEPEWAYPETVLNWSERYYADECARADTLLAELDRLAARRKRRARRPSGGAQAGR